MTSDRTHPSRAQFAWEIDPSCSLCGHAIEEFDGAVVIPYEDQDRVAHRACAKSRQTNVPHRPLKLPLGGT